MSRWAAHPTFIIPRIPRIPRTVAPTLAHGRYAHAHVGAVAYHGISDRDTAAQQIDTQLISIVSAVLRAAGADAGLIRWRDKHKAAYDAYAAHDADLKALEKRLALAPWDWMAKQSYESIKAKAPHEIADFLDRTLRSREAIERSPYLGLWDDAVSPTFNEWEAFYSTRRNWYDAATEITTSWEDYLAWANRVNALRAKVEAAGIRVDAPPMRQFSESIQEHVEDFAHDAKDAAKSVFDLTKILIYSGLALGGAVVVTSLVSHARGGTDPIERWAALRK